MKISYIDKINDIVVVDAFREIECPQVGTLG